MDTDGRWTIKRGRRRPAEGEPQARITAEIAVPVFGYKNHLGIDRHHGFIRTFTVTDAAGHDGRQLGKLLDPHTPRTASGPIPPTARPATSRCWPGAGWCPSSKRPKPRGKPMPSNVRRGNATRARVRVAIEHVFAAQKCRFGLVVRSVGRARATTKVRLANLVTKMRRLVWFETGAAPT